jgi:transposase-like protein
MDTMAITVCPECDYRLAALVRREVKNNEVFQHFECAECEHEWSDTIL